MESIFYEILDMSIKASWLISAVLLARLLLRKAPKNIRCILWALVAVRLMLPFSIESAFSLVPSEEDFMGYQSQEIENAPVISEESENEIADFNTVVISDEVTYKNAFDWTDLIMGTPYAWFLGVAIIALYSLLSYISLKKQVKIALLYDEEAYLCDSIDAPFILGVLKPRIYLPSAISEKELEHVLYHERTHLMRKDNWWKLIGFIILLVHWFNPLVWLSYILFSRDLELACDEMVVKDMAVEERKVYSTTLLYYSVPHKNMFAYPLAFGEVAVKDRVKSVLNYKKPAFWIILIAIACCILLAICFLTSPKSNEDSAENEEYNGSSDILMQDSYYSIVTDIYPAVVRSMSVSTDYPVYRINAGNFFYCQYYPDNPEWSSMGDIVEIELTNKNFDSLIDSWRMLTYVDIKNSERLIKRSAKELREENVYAWTVSGNFGDFILMEQESGGVYLVECKLENGEPIEIDGIMLLSRITSEEMNRFNEVYFANEEYSEHFGECTVDLYAEDVSFIQISPQSFNNGDDALYIEPEKIDDEHYGVFIHFEKASGTIDTMEYKIPAVRTPLVAVPEISIECSNDIKIAMLSNYATYLNNWNGKENGRTPDLFEEIDFNEKNTPLFKVPDWQEFRAGEIILQFPEGLCPDKADVEDVVLNDDGSIRYKGRDDEVVFRGADTSRINDTVAFSLANHSSINLYEDVSEEDALTKPFYRGYKVRCYWATTDGLQSITYLFVIRTQYNGS